MTSEEFIADLRNNGVKLIEMDGSLTEIPSDFLERATEFCNLLGCSSISYIILLIRRIASIPRSVCLIVGMWIKKKIN